MRDYTIEITLAVLGYRGHLSMTYRGIIAF